MKFVFFSGGAGGFILASATDYVSGRSADRMLLDGAIGCLAGALLMRWFWTVLLQGVRETYVARHRAAAAAATTRTAPPAAPAPAPATKPRI